LRSGTNNGHASTMYDTTDRVLSGTPLIVLSIRTVVSRAFHPSTGLGLRVMPWCVPLIDHGHPPQARLQSQHSVSSCFFDPFLTASASSFYLLPKIQSGTRLSSRKSGFRPPHQYRAFHLSFSRSRSS